MAITPSEDVKDAPEPLPRGPLVESGGQLSRSFFNWFQGKDRKLGEIISGVNLNRQNIVQLQTDYQAADGSLSSAYIAADAVVAADATSARATLSATLTAAFEAADAGLQTQVNSRATITYVDTAIATEQSARASAISTVEAAFAAADSTISASVSTNASAIASLEGATAIYEIIAAASGGNPARIKLKAGVGGADVELDADRVWFGDETRFDTTSETFITEVGGVRSRYGTAFGASGNQVVMWHGPDSVTLGSEARNNGYLAIGTNGSIWYNTGALDWGATASAAAAQTSIGTAAAIAGQGWGATASEAAASNARVPNGVNQLVDHDFRFAVTYWRHTPQSGSLSYTQTETAGVRRRTLTGAGVTVGNWIQIDSFPDRVRFACKAGDVVEASAYVSASNCSSGTIFIQFFNAAGSSAGFSTLVSFTPGTAVAELSDFVRASVLATAPAGTAYAMINIRGVASTSAPVLHVAKPMLAIANSGQTAPSAWNPGLAYTPGADPTGANTAAAITGQGVYATANYYSSETDPAPVPDGSDWYKPSTKELKKRVASAWQLMGRFTDAALAISRTNGFVKTRIGAGTITSDSVSFSSTGGSGTGYTYAHELFATATTGPTLTISSSSGSPITCSAASAVPGDEVRGFVQTTVTDSDGNKATLLSPVALFCES